MCWVSAVMDNWRPYIPTPPPIDERSLWPALPTPAGITLDPEKLRKLLDAFHRAVEAAEAFDRLTGQPDCIDPEKAKLLKRVETLERRLDEHENKRKRKPKG